MVVAHCSDWHSQHRSGNRAIEGARELALERSDARLRSKRTSSSNDVKDASSVDNDLATSSCALLAGSWKKAVES